MLIDYVSDLHFEINGPPKLVWPDRQGNILILGGDITCYAFFQEHRTDSPSRKMHNLFSKFIIEDCAGYDDILYVPGNHEYYRFYMDGADEWAEKRFKKIDPRIRVMRDTAMVTDTCTIVGSTMWTDINGGDPLSVLVADNQMRDYISIMRDSITKRTIKPHDTIRANDSACESIKSIYYNRDRSKKFIVATHHSPSIRGHDVIRFTNNNIMYAFNATNMDEFINDSEIDVWIHGHTHSDVEYDINGTRITSCMYGYFGIDTYINAYPKAVGQLVC